MRLVLPDVGRAREVVQVAVHKRAGCVQAIDSATGFRLDPPPLRRRQPDTPIVVRSPEARDEGVVHQQTLSTMVEGPGCPVETFEMHHGLPSPPAKLDGQCGLPGALRPNDRDSVHSDHFVLGRGIPVGWCAGQRD